MREVSVSEITKNIREMCIEANHFLSPDMKQVFDEAVSREESPLGKQILNQLEENLRIAGEDMIIDEGLDEIGACHGTGGADKQQDHHDHQQRLIPPQIAHELS